MTGGGSGVVFTGGRALLDGMIRPADIVVDDGLITEVLAPGEFAHVRRSGVETVELHDAVIAPGFIDTQCNGALGSDITSDPHSVRAVADALPRWGVTSFLPTVITSTAQVRAAAMSAVAAARSNVAPDGADIVGLHFEGPALSPARMGTHDVAFQGIPDADEVAEWCASGQVAMVTLAPELPGADTLIARLVDAGVVVSLGHTDATAAQTRAAVQRGVRGVTHLFNAMPPLHHREPGPVGVALDDPRLFVGLICDGIHVDPTAVRLAWRILGPRRTMLATDGTAAMGMADGSYAIGTIAIDVRDGAVRNRDGALAGSLLTFDSAVRQLIEMSGCSLPDALTAAATTPARFARLDDRGAIEVGRRADLVILETRVDDTTELRVHGTYVQGRCAWRS